MLDKDYLSEHIMQFSNVALIYQETKIKSGIMWKYNATNVKLAFKLWRLIANYCKFLVAVVATVSFSVGF